MLMVNRQSVKKEGTLITIVTELQHTAKRTTLQTFNQFPLLMAADVVKSSTTLNKRTIQKLIEMRLNPQITHKGILRVPVTQNKI